MSELAKQCEEIYVHAGQSGVYDFINTYYPNIPWEYCQACDCGSPSENHLCLVCGEQTTDYDWQSDNNYN